MNLMANINNHAKPVNVCARTVGPEICHGKCQRERERLHWLNQQYYLIIVSYLNSFFLSQARNALNKHEIQN
jgi:hypothetical protein